MDELIEAERIARMNKDEEKIKEVFLLMLRYCNTDEEAISLLKSLSRRNGQIKPAFQWFTMYVFQIKKNIYEENKNEEALSTYLLFLRHFLKEVIEGKLFLEHERMVVSNELKILYEKQGDLKSAMDIIFDIPVETFSTIKEENIIGFQLEQLRVSIANHDWIKADVCGKRIRKRYFTSTNDLERESVFDKLMIEFYLGVKNYIDAGRVAVKLSGKENASKNVILASFLTLISEFGDERNGILSELVKNKNNSESVRRVLVTFLKNDLVKLDEILVFKQYIEIDSFKDVILACVDTHNLIVISKSCTVLKLDTIATLLNCSVEEVVEKICKIVNNGILNCKMDQIKQQVRFNSDLRPDWIVGVDEILSKIMKANHLIKKEILEHKSDD